MRRTRELEHFASEAPDAAGALIVVAELLTVMQISPDDEAAQRAKARAYVEACEDIPTWALRAARLDWYKGNVPDGMNARFAPMPADLVAVAKSHMQRVRAELYRLQRLANGVPMPPEKAPVDPNRVQEIIRQANMNTTTEQRDELARENLRAMTHEELKAFQLAQWEDALQHEGTVAAPPVEES